MNRRDLLRAGGLSLASVPLLPAFGQIGPVAAQIRPTHPATRQLLRRSIVQVYADLKANSPNAARINLLAGQLSVFTAGLDDDGMLAPAQAAWHPKTMVWTTQDTANLVSNAATMGVIVDPSLFSDMDQLVQNQRETFPLQIDDVLARSSGHMLKAAASIQAHTGYQPASFHPVPHLHAQTSCPYGSGTIALLMGALAGALAASGMTYAAAVVAAAAAIERLLDSFSNCDDRLGG